MGSKRPFGPKFFAIEWKFPESWASGTGEGGTQSLCSEPGSKRKRMGWSGRKNSNESEGKKQTARWTMMLLAQAWKWNAKETGFCPGKGRWGVTGKERREAVESGETDQEVHLTGKLGTSKKKKKKKKILKKEPH